MTLIGTIFGLIPALLKGLFFWSLKKAGRTDAELRVAESKLETLRRAKKVDDAIDSMPIDVVRRRLLHLSKRLQRRVG